MQPQKRVRMRTMFDYIRGTTNQLSLPLFDSAEEAAQYIPPAGGFFALLTQDENGRKHQNSYPVSSLHTVLGLLDPRRDSWISQAVFWTPKRRVVNTKSLSLNFLDIDYYKNDGNGWTVGKTPERIAEDFNDICDSEGIPRPSLIVHSGRGIQPKWLYDSPIPRMALPRWNAIESVLIRRLKPYGVDSAVRDAARVLRVVRTVNSRSGQICRVVGMNNDGNGAPVQYGFEELCEHVLPKPRPQSYLQVEEQKSRVPHKPSNGFTTQTLNWARLEDIRTLIKLRGGIDEGLRMIFLMYSMNFLALSGQVSAQTFYSEAAVIAHEIDPTWRFRLGDLRTVFEKMCAYHRGEKVFLNGREYPILYTPRSETLIDILQITSEEMASLSTIIDQNERRIRNAKAQERVRRSAGSVSREEYEAHAFARKERAQALRAEGMSIRRIAEIMGLSKSQIHRYL